jgi:phosphoribosylformylglycinamidine cyclo-ligase
VACVCAVTYRDAGVDIEKGDQFAEGIYPLMVRTFTDRVIANPGGFGALFSLDYDTRLFRQNFRHPVLVSSTDGVGTKLKVAFMTGRHETVGIDLVAMCVNDVLVQGAEPLFFLDYLATGRLEPDVLHSVVAGVAEGCRIAGCSLLGGETAEMPGFYSEGEYDMAGFAVGVVEKSRLIDGRLTEPGDVVIGLPSSGLHSNGYSLARRLFFEEAGLGPSDSLERFGIGRTLGEELLVPTRIYVKPVRTVLHHYRVKKVVTSIAHITGGGLLENVPRVLPEGCGMEVDAGSWRRPAVFDALQQIGGLPDEEMYRTFNMGIGMVLIVSPFFAASVMQMLKREGEEPASIGRVVEGEREVRIS